MVVLEPLRRHLEQLDLEGILVEAVLACFRPRRLTRGSAFIRAGECEDRLGFVVSGLFAMESPQPEGRLFIKDFLGPGAFLLGSFEPARESLVTFTRCPVADMARLLGDREWLYHLVRGVDPAIVEGFNQGLGLRRTRTLMEGHDCCDHFFFVKRSENESAPPMAVCPGSDGLP